LAAGRRNTLVMAVDDRVYLRDPLETYLYYSELLPGAALCFRGASGLIQTDGRHLQHLI
jgi:hypothetical protein